MPKLLNILSSSLNWNKSRIQCFANILEGIIKTSSCNLKKISISIEGNALTESRYRRVKKFFHEFDFDTQELSERLLRMFQNADGKCLFALDRTNWWFGKKPINIMILAVLFEGLAIPVYWKVLDKAGTSSAAEQIEIMQEFIERFGADQIEGFFADREFGNIEFLGWLTAQKIPFYIRVKDNVKFRIFKNSKPFNLNKIFKNVQTKTCHLYEHPVEIGGVKLRVAASRSEEGERMVIATNANGKVATYKYLLRWGIECLFQALKGRGFNFEDTHLTDPRKISKLLALLSVAVALCIKLGEWKANIRPIPFNRYENSTRPKYSYFRYGLDRLKEWLFDSERWRRFGRKCMARINQLFAGNRKIDEKQCVL